MEKNSGNIDFCAYVDSLCDGIGLPRAVFVPQHSNYIFVWVLFGSMNFILFDILVPTPFELVRYSIRPNTF